MNEIEEIVKKFMPDEDEYLQKVFYDTALAEATQQIHAEIQKQVTLGKIAELELIQKTGRDHDLAGAVKWLIDDRIATLQAELEEK